MAKQQRHVVVIGASSIRAKGFEEQMRSTLRQGQELTFVSLWQPRPTIDYFRQHGPDSEDGVDITYIETQKCFDGSAWVLIAKHLTGGRSIVMLGPDAEGLAPLFKEAGVDVFVNEEVPVPGKWYDFLKGDALCK